MALRQLALEQLVDRTHEGFWFIDTEANTLDVNPAMCTILGRPREELLGRSIFDFVDAQNLTIFQEEIAARRAGTRTGTYEIALLRPTGENIPCINNASSIWDDEGIRIGSIGLWTDISKLKAVEAELRQVRATLEDRVEERTIKLQQNEARLHEAHKIARLGSWEIDASGRLHWADEVFDLIGADRRNFDGTSAFFYDQVHPDDRERVRDETEHAWAHLNRYETVHRVVLRDGTIRTVRESADVIRDDYGQTVKMAGTVQDITEQVAAEERLRAAQKMEAIGQLSGGIAHDFNNLLGVIIGSAEFMEMTESYDSELVRNIIHAAERGAELTHRMLAYARRQPLHAAQFEMSELMSNMMSVLTRSLGATISIEYRENDDLWPVMADSGQVEDALLNLAINARDAMPGGGDLIIECNNEVISPEQASATPDAMAGDFVTLSVSDTGCGMPDDVLEHATEPFFSTKGTNGSGLGLSMVYGFARQSGGHLTISSQPGIGTTIKFYLPRAGQGGLMKRHSDLQEPTLGNNQQILVIEDDPAVCKLVERMLRSLKYKPTGVHDAIAARAMLQQGKAFDLILSDVVLPNGISGPEFANEIRAEHPDLKIIFMSGYPVVDAQQNELIGSDRVLLNKPLKRANLANAVQTALHE